VGTAIGLLVYWLAVMGVTWPGPQKTALQIAAIVLVVIARQIVKPIETKRWPYGLAAVALIVGAGFGFGVAKGAIATAANATLTARELPGFTVSLPDGNVTQNLAYLDGSFKIENLAGTGANLQVQWEPGKMFEDDELTMLSAAITHAVEATLDGAPQRGTTAHGNKSVVLRAHGDKGDLVVTVIECGARRVTVMTVGASDTGTLHQRVVDSFVCHPDPKSDAEIGALPWTIDLPASWQKVQAPAGQAHYLDTSNGSMLVIRGLSEAPDRNGLKALIEPVMAAAGMTVTLGAWSDDRFPMTATLQGQTMTGFVMPVTCKAGGALVMALATDEGQLDVVHDLVTKAGHCATTDVLKR
jgi:hypothetical protein